MRDLFFRPGPGGVPVYIPSRYKVAYGGRGSAKSWSFAGLCVVLGTQHKLRILCAREYQTSIRDSIYKLITDRIEQMGLLRYYEIQAQAIFGVNGTEFIFAGIKTDPLKIKSLEAIDICLVEEAERVSDPSWKYLIPTIRTKFGSSEIWVCFNPRDETDPTYQRFVLRNRHDMRRVQINWSDNPWFPAELQAERENDWARIAESTDDDERAQLQADYDHVWEGHLQKNSNASVFRRRVVIESFEDPPEYLQMRMFYGADWGFANDPTALIRFWVTHNADNTEELWISHEAFGYRVEIDETAQLFDSVPGARAWPIHADSARPETISYMARHGFNISAAEKWPGSLEDGVAHLKGFIRIHIHERCKHMQEEARLYAYKVDRITAEVLPIIVDANNHGWDAVRYGLDGYILRRGVNAQWERLGE
jgi:phage terminase large subunit